MLERSSSAVTFKPIDWPENVLLTIFQFLSPNQMHDLMMLSRDFNRDLKLSDYWKDKVKQSFPKEYQKLESMPNPNWYDIFKRLYYLYYDGLPERTIRIFSAVRLNDIDALKRLNLVFGDLRLEDNTRQTLRHYIASSRNQCLMDFVTEELVHPYYLPDNTYDKLKIDSVNEGLFHYLAHFNQLASEPFMRFIMGKSSLINVNSMRINAPLHYAAMYGHVSVIHSWLDFGFPVDSMNGENVTPLYIAALAGQVDSINALCDRGAKVNVDNVVSLLQAAAAGGHYLAFTYLVARSVNAGLQIEDQSVLLHAAALGGNVDIFNEVISNTKDARIDARDRMNKTALHYAAEGGHFDFFEVLLARGANIGAICFEGNTILHYAAMGMNADIVNMIQKAFDVNARNYKSETPLHYAAKVSHKFSHEVVDILLTAKANVYAVTMHQPVPDVRGLWPEEDGRETPLHYAAKANDVVTVEKLLALGAEVNAVSSNGSTPIFYAVEYPSHSVRVLDKLLAAGANVNVKRVSIELGEHDNSIEEAGITPLHLAVRSNNFPAVIKLLDKGADVNATNDYNETPLHLAVFNKNLEMIKVLILRGADVHSVNLSGKTPLMLYLKRFHNVSLDCVEILVSQGASVKKNAFADLKDFHCFRRNTISEYAFKMVLNATPNIRALLLNDINIIPSNLSGDCDLEQNSLLRVERIEMTGTEFCLLPVLKVILKAAPHAELAFRKPAGEVIPEIYAICKEVYEETRHRGAGIVLAFACEYGCIAGIPLNLVYAKEIYASLGVQKKVNEIQEKIHAIRVSAVGVFAPLPALSASVSEKRTLENDESSSKRQKK